MSQKVLGINTRTEIATGYGPAKTIATISHAVEGVVGATAHGFADGDIVVLAVPSGMVELDGQAARIKGVDTDHFTLEGVDTQTLSDHAGGTATVQKVTTWQTLSDASQISAPSAQANRINTTTLLDVQQQEQFGLPGAVQGSITAFFNPLSPATAELRKATESNQARVLRVTFQNGVKWIQNAYWSGGDGFDLQQGAAATQQIGFTSIKRGVFYAA